MMISDPLPSWRTGAIKSTILDFVQQIVTPGSPHYQSPAERIAVFDNDGTLWCEQPIQIQIFFLLDEIKKLPTENPVLATQQPFKAVLENDKEAMSNFTKKELMTLFFGTHTGMSPESFVKTATAWLDSSKHPRFQQLFKTCLFQPMRELLDFLKANEFKNFIVTGGGMDFVRAIAEEIYDIPAEQIIGSTSKVKYQLVDDLPLLTKLPELNSFNDREVKVENIGLHIGRRPLLAFGNSDGDLAMLHYTSAGEGKRLVLLLHHDDADREYAYDRDFKLSPCIEALEVVPQLPGGMIVSMKQDWQKVFPFEG
jgi:phosphoglycolate phosphatase-like HAD superfamily hydrolase